VFVFSKVDTGNNFCRNSFLKVDTVVQHLEKPMFARENSSWSAKGLKPKVDTA